MTKVIIYNQIHFSYFSNVVKLKYRGSWRHFLHSPRYVLQSVISSHSTIFSKSFSPPLMPGWWESERERERYRHYLYGIKQSHSHLVNIFKNHHVLFFFNCSPNSCGLPSDIHHHPRLTNYFNWNASFFWHVKFLSAFGNTLELK